MVVVGGGHNGLVAANYLADAGLDVTVAEANESIGGFTSTGATIPEAPRHLINSYSVDAFFWDAFPPSYELGLERFGLRRVEIDPGHVYLHPDGGSIGFWADARRTAEEIRRFSAADATAYLEFARVLRRFGNIMLTLARTNPVRPEVGALATVAREAFAGRRDLAELGSFPFASVTEVVAERFTHQVVRDALHAASGSTVPNNSNLNCGQMKVDLALSGRVDVSRYERGRGDGLDLRRPSFMTGTEAGMERLFARCGAGLLPDEDDWSLWPVIPTAADPSQAPDGQDTVYLYAAVAPYRPDGGWDSVRDKAAQAIVANAARYLDGITDLEIGRQVLTNTDMATKGHATGGSITHVDMVLGRAGPLRPARGLSGYRTPVDGLYLGAAGCHPGGGITGGPGYVSARTMIRDLRRGNRRRLLRRRVVT